MNFHFLENDFIRLSVSDRGAELRSLQCVRTSREWMWQASPEYWPRTAPVLFPIVGKLQDNELRHGGKSFSLTQHGFARDQVFQLKAVEPGLLQFHLESDEETKKSFPFTFGLGISYELKENALLVHYRVENPGVETLFFSLGAHPGFCLPSFPRKEYFLEFAVEEILERIPLKEGLLRLAERIPVPISERKLPVKMDLFTDDVLIFCGLKSGFLDLKEENSKDFLRFHFKEFPYLGIWSKPGAPFVCIEPWFGHADPVGFQGDFSQKPGILSLLPSEVFECSYTVELWQ